MKQKLLRALDEGQKRETELQALVVDEPANPDGRWNAKDHLAHLAWWRVHNAELLERLRAGGTDDADINDDEQNAATYAANRDRPAAAVKQDAKASWDRVAQTIEACSEEDLSRPHPRVAGAQLWDTITGNVFGHLAQHFEFWYLARGDEAAAEAAQLWDYELEAGVAPDAEPRWYVTYNLACFYGRLGHADKALPLLRRSFEKDPSLKTHARKDPDLDRIRQEPEVKELLAT